ncbi:hypothetical protein QCA50_008383 [Cerrena zonata]|uniref:DUF3752 domain-containing protein n=1 Tax=Cerrena zonata TaxID=2478898 RepID=A0AAW0G2S6_9APHY
MIGPDIPPEFLQGNRSTTPDDEQEAGPSLPPASSIGPEIPTHLVNRSTTPDEEQDGPIGPSIPPEVLTRPTVPAPPSQPEDEEEDDYAPALPPELLAARAGPSKAPSASASSRRPVGPSFPSRYDAYDEDSDDEDGVQEFLEKEERRRKQIEEASKPKALKREEWMLVPPSSSDLLSNIDPTKLKKSRQFARSTGQGRDVDNSLWTETPAERQQRLADEVAGKRRRAVNADPDADPEAIAEARKKRKYDEEIRKGVDEHTRKNRGAALVQQHQSKGGKEKKGDDDGPPAIWDHGRDMGLGGRLVDDKTRNKFIQEARGLGDRFGTGKSGGFL